MCVIDTVYSIHINIPVIYSIYIYMEYLSKYQSHVGYIYMCIIYIYICMGYKPLESLGTLNNGIRCEPGFMSILFDLSTHEK